MKVKDVRSQPDSPAAQPGLETARTGHSPSTVRAAGHIQRALDEQGICTLTFDRVNANANVIDHAALLELDSHLDWIEHTPTVRGVLIWSAKEGSFITGPDLRALEVIAGRHERTVDNPAREVRLERPTLDRDPAMELIQLGQGVLNRLSALTIPTVAAIHGACVGGGFEVALACERRIASASRDTRFGLPETSYGIIPAWGGCARLPRLIGIPKALELILGGRTVGAERALKLGMIDEMVTPAQLLATARERLLQPRPIHRSNLRVVNNSISAMLTRSRTARLLSAATRGHLPAPFEALDVVTHGVSLPFDRALSLEREAMARLLQGESSHRLAQLFFDTVKAKQKNGGTGSPGPVVPEVRRLGIIGAGVMGTGIAQWASSRGLAVILRDVSLERLVKGVNTVAQLYSSAVQKGWVSEQEARDGQSRIFAAASDAPLSDVDLVVEAATENLALKQDVFRCLAARTAPTTVLATNTSAFSITELGAATGAAERVVGLHFFHPVADTELVEVVAGEKTSPETRARAMGFIRQMGKAPVLVRDAPGFLVHRLLAPYLIEAVRLFDSGVAAQEIDEAMLEFGMRIGPLQFLDDVGLDIAAPIVATMVRKFGDRLAPPPLFERMIAAKMTGRALGRGFYQYPERRPNHDLLAMRAIHRPAHRSSAELSERMSLLLVNEAARCLEEQIAGSASDLDLAAVLGAGFAPFRGGPLRYADDSGLPGVAAALEKLAADDARFAPCQLLKTLAAKGGSFHSPSSTLSRP